MLRADWLTSGSCQAAAANRVGQWRDKNAEYDY
jgi:hypothetical protein